MRRVQIDGGSQPVRNLLTNPSCETASGTSVIRSNLCLNPQMTGVTGALVPVRTNRCINPRGVLTMLHYSGAGAQTITNNVAVTAPEGITTALRFTFGPSASNPGLNIMSPVTANTTYTMSAYVMIESLTSTPGSGGFAENGVISGTNVDNAIIGTWQKITWTRTTTASPGPNFGIRFAAVGGTGTGSILVTGIVIEIADASGASTTFFDGATATGGGFTYRWTGTANNSSSEQNAPTVGNISPRWFGSGGGQGVTYQSSSTGIGGSASIRKAWRIGNTGNSNDTGISVTMAVSAGTYYTASISQNPSFTTNICCFIIWLDSGGATISQTANSTAIASPAGTWTRHSVVAAQAPTGAVSATFVFGPYNVGATPSPATPGGSTIDWDDCLIEVSLALLPFFSGNTSASGDFTYAFSGTANGSISQMRAPSVASIPNSGTSAIVQSSEWSSSVGKSARVMHLPQSSVAEGIIADHTSILKPGKTYTALGKLRLDTVATASHTRSRRFNLYVSTNGGANYTETNGPQAANAVGVYDIRFTFSIPANATNSILRIGGHSFGSSIPLQADAWWDDLMVVEGVYTGDYIDGSRPLSKWDGTANASTSVGYPPQFLDHSGSPEYDLINTAGGAGFTLPGGFGDTEARTIYTVFVNLQDITDSTVPTILTYGSTALSDTVPNSFITLRQQTVAGPNNLLLARRTGGSGASAIGAKPGVNVAAWGLNNSGFIFNSMNNGSVVTDNQVMALPHQRIFISAPTAWGSHIRTIVFRGYHSDATRAAITRHLGNKYGAPVA